jgi:hypothetical protein
LSLRFYFNKLSMLNVVTIQNIYNYISYDKYARLNKCIVKDNLTKNSIYVMSFKTRRNGSLSKSLTNMANIINFFLCPQFFFTQNNQ